MTSTEVIIHAVILILGLLMVLGGVWDLLKRRARSSDGDIAMLNRWGTLAVLIFGIILFGAGLTHVFGPCAIGA